MRRIVTIMATLLLFGCGGEARVPTPVRAPDTAPLQPRAVVAIGTREAVFLPDGRVAMPLAHALHVFDPAHPETGEVVPFEGALHVAGNHVFAFVSGDTDRLVELDARFHEIHSVDIGSLPFGATTDDGEYFLVAGKGLFRTRDFAPLLQGVTSAPPPGRQWGRLEATRDGRYLIGHTVVVDLATRKIVFSHDALAESARLVDRGRLYWVFRDLLETVDLATGARTRTWLPCRGPSAADADAATLYTSCERSVIRHVLGAGVPKSDTLTTGGALEVDRLIVNEDGRLVVSTDLPVPASGEVKHGPTFSMARGGSKLEPGATLVAGRTRIEPLPGLGSDVLRLTNGKTSSVRPFNFPAQVSTDGRFALFGRAIVSLESGERRSFSVPDVAPQRLVVRDGAIVIAAVDDDSKVMHELRLAPRVAQSPKERVSIAPEERNPDADLADPTSRVTVEDERGARTASFSTTVRATVGEPWGEGVALRSLSYTEDRFAYCTRAGKCQEAHGERGLVGLARTFAFHAQRRETSLTIDELGTEKSATLDLGAPIASAMAANDGVYAIVGEKPRRLVHVSAKGPHVTRDVPLDGIDGSAIGVVGNTLVFSEGPVVRYYDEASLAPKGLVVYSAKGYVHIHEDGRYTLHGDTSALLPSILCTSGSQVLRLTSCESVTMK